MHGCATPLPYVLCGTQRRTLTCVGATRAEPAGARRLALRRELVEQLVADQRASEACALMSELAEQVPRTEALRYRARACELCIASG